jgi:hypothetical protein
MQGFSYFWETNKTIMKSYYGKYLIIEKPSFTNNFPKIKLLLSKHCYLLPTGNGFSKSMHEHRFEGGYGSDVYACQAFMVTYAYTIFFLWFRLHIEFVERKMCKSLMQNFRPTDKSKTTIEDVLGS